MARPPTFVQVCFFLSVVAFRPNMVSCMTVYCTMYGTSVHSLECSSLHTYVELRALTLGQYRFRFSRKRDTTLCRTSG